MSLLIGDVIKKIDVDMTHAHQFVYGEPAPRGPGLLIEFHPAKETWRIMWNDGSVTEFTDQFIESLYEVISPSRYRVSAHANKRSTRV